MKRRAFIGLLAAGLPLAAAHAGEQAWHDVDITGTSPSLDFVMQQRPIFRRKPSSIITVL